MNEEVDVQPNGVRVEKTLEVVERILQDTDFAAEVAEHNGWSTDADVRETALRFLASRYQWSVSLLSLQTNNLKAEMDALSDAVRHLQDRATYVE